MEKLKKTAVLSMVALPVLLAASPALAGGLPAFAHVAKYSSEPINTGDTAWMLVSTALVLLMTIPGLALFYAGMVRKKNILATMGQSFACTALITIVWYIAGYSIAFAPGNEFIGGASGFFLSGLGGHWSTAFILGRIGTAAALPTHIPESVYIMYEMTFAIITPALITGAFAERMKFKSMAVFLVAWTLIVYAPVAHWIWAPGGWLAEMGVADFAGGIVVHTSAGIASLVCALVLGKRLGWGKKIIKPHNLTLAMIGAGLLWVGWFGFNGGSALGANGRAGMAILATQIAAAAASLCWMLAEWVREGRPTTLGLISGAVAGLATITPASGYVLPDSALLIGVVAGFVCYFMVAFVKSKFGYDDTLDAFGVHGVGGMIGSILVGVLAFGPLTDGAVKAGGHQLTVQVLAVAAVVVWSGLWSYVLLKVIEKFMGLRVTEADEEEGLDLSIHDEKVDDERTGTIGSHGEAAVM